MSFLIFRKYIGILKALWFPFITSGISGFFSNILKIILPLLSILLFDYAYPQRDSFVFLAVILSGLCLYFLDYFFSSSYEYLSKLIQQEVSNILSSRLFEKILKLPAYEQVNLKTLSWQVKITEDPAVAADVLVNLPLAFILEVVRIIFFFIIYAFINPVIALFSAFLIPIYILEREFFLRRSIETNTPKLKIKEFFVKNISEKLSNLKIVKAFLKENFELKRFQTLLLNYGKATQKNVLLTYISVFSGSTILQLWKTMIVAFFGYQVIQGKISIGQLVALMAYLPFFEIAAKKFSTLFPDFKKGLFCLNQMDKFLNLPEEESKGKDVVSEDFISEGKIHFEKISATYDKTVAPILDHIDFDIPSCSSLAIVGESGAGKSFLFNLLIRFHQPLEGIIYIDGKNLQEISVRDLRTHIGVVFQDITLFEGTIKENILYGNSQASEEEMIECAKIASIHEDICHMSQGYDTVVARLGANLSGGIKQRIALARALLLKPKILILDEATSGLDAESEFLVKEALKRCQKHMSIVMIAHRLSMIKSFDQILVLEKGHIVEKGTFSELLKSKGAFFKLYHLQFGGLEEFKRRIEIEIERYFRYKQALSLLFLEINEYELNAKKYGTHMMDVLMENIELYACKNVRVMDFTSLFHLNKIVVGLPETTKEKAYLAAKRLSENISKTPFVVDTLTFHVTVSYGAISLEELEVKNSDNLWQNALEDLEQKRKSYADSQKGVKAA